MARRKKSKKKKPIENYDHKDKERLNNPPVGLVTPDTDKDGGKKKYQYDPHIDPSLQWAGKAEHTSFEVPTVSLHVHERIEPQTIIEAVRRKNGPQQAQMFFQFPEENPPLRDAIQFYKHAHNWSNRLIAGDSLLVMNSLLEKEGMAGQVQMIYIDPPYGIKYGSNFQPFVNKRDVKDGKDEDLTAEPEMIKAFRDTWELGIHSYLTYLRDRLLLAKELLTESGSCFVQIGQENVHRVRLLLDEVYSPDNYVGQITFRTTGGRGAKYIDQVYNVLLWYARDSERLKYRPLFLEMSNEEVGSYDWMEENGEPRQLGPDEVLKKQKALSEGRLYKLDDLTSQGETDTGRYEIKMSDQVFQPRAGRHWRTTKAGIDNLAKAKRLQVKGQNLFYKHFANDYPVRGLDDIWEDAAMGGFHKEEAKVYVVQTPLRAIQRCVLMSTDPGDLVFDPTCGSGTTAYVAERWGRRWITCDTSRVAITLAKQRLMTALFDYYELAHESEGVGSGFKYNTIPHITLKSIANNEPPAEEALYDQPFVDNSKARVTGPFTVEAVPAQAVKQIDEIEEQQVSDESVARSGETLRQAEWRDELLRTGIRGKGGQYIKFSRVEPMGGTRWLNADAETKGDKSERVVISFGPEHQPLEQRQVALAIEEAQLLVPKPSIVVFTAFQFDPEAAKDIDETDWPGVTLLKAQMNADLLTDDLKKKRSSNESFWLIGQPDVKLQKITQGEDAGKYKVEVLGFDYYDTRTGNIDSGGTDKIAMWLLDTDYDGRSIYARQVFFPMAGEKEGWARLAKNLKAEIDEERICAYRGTESLPFEVGDNKRIAVKIIDDRGIESLKILEVD